MPSTSFDPAQERARLRDEYKLRARSIIQALQSLPKPAYTRAELTELGVSVQIFNPEDQAFADSKACLFEPLTREGLAEYTIDERGLTEPERRYLYEFGDTFDEDPYFGRTPKEGCVFYRAYSITRALEIIQERYRKKEKKGGREGTFSLETLSGWGQMRASDPFYGFLYENLQERLYPIDYARESIPRDLPRWPVQPIWHLFGRVGDPDEATRPHMRLVTIIGAEPKEDELLHGELGPIVNTIQCRLAQQEFEQTSLFPVFVLSLFGPRHARLLQARFDISGTLSILSSPIYNFVHSNENMGLFVRYYNCTPRDGDEFARLFIREDPPSPYMEHPRWHAKMAIR